MPENLCEDKNLYRSASGTTSIPNIIFDLGLDVYSTILYLYLFKTAGISGNVFLSIKEMSKVCNMSETKVKESIRILKCKFEKIGCSLITITHRYREDGGIDKNMITVNQIGEFTWS